MEVINSFHGYPNLKKILQGDIKHKVARPYQNEGVYSAICKNSKITCITASGKSFIILSRAYKEAQLNRKQLICVPTKAIGIGFKKTEEVEFEHDTFTFQIDNDLCTENNGDADLKSDSLISFIEQDINSIITEDYIYLVTHKTLVRAFQKLQDAKKLSKLRNITLHIDEAHKIHYEDDKQESQRINEIGKVIKHFIKYSDSKSMNINLVTATFYRNQFEDIVPKDFEWEYELKINSLEYLKYCQYINGFNYSLRIDSGEYTDSIKKIFDEDSTKPTIIFMPHSSSNQCLSYLDKYASVDEIRKAINDRNLTIVSLVEENTRMDALNYIKDNDDVDVVINIKVAGEGFDWPKCSRVIICGHRTSLLELPQNIGRVMRDHDTKSADNQPEVIQIISKVDTENAEKEELTEVFNNILKLVGGQLLLLSDLYSKEATKIHKIGSKTTSILDYMNENITANDRLKLEKTLRQDFMKFVTLNDDEYTDDDLKEIIRNRIVEFNLEESDVLIRYFLNEQKRRTWNSTPQEDIKILKRKLKTLYRGFNIDEIDIDLIGEEIDSLGWIKNISSKFLNVSTFTELEGILKQFTRIEKIKEIKQWVIDNN